MRNFLIDPRYKNRQNDTHTHTHTHTHPHTHTRTHTNTGFIKVKKTACTKAIVLTNVMYEFATEFLFKMPGNSLLIFLKE